MNNDKGFEGDETFLQLMEDFEADEARKRMKNLNVLKVI